MWECSPAPVVPCPAPTVVPVIPPTPQPTDVPSIAPTKYHTLSPSIKPTESHMTCVPSPCPGRKLNEFGVEIDDPDYAEEAEDQLSDAEADALVAAFDAKRAEALNAAVSER